MTGENKEIGESIIKAVGLAVKDIDNDLIEIYPKDTATKANQTLKSAFELSEMGIKIVIGPVFYESLTYLDEMKDLTFLSLTNKTLDLPKNVISAGINSTSQFNTIKKFLETNQIQRTIFLTPIQDYEFEVKRGMKNSKIKIYKDYEYNTEPTKLTKQIEEITNYRIRKQNLEDEIKRSDKIINFNHKENKFIDFNIDRLIPEMISNEGPALSLSDVNNDGIDDFFVGGAKFQNSKIFISHDNKYIVDSLVFSKNRNSEDVASIFFDADGDSDKDLYVCSGGRAFSNNDIALKDRIYINDGKGNFKYNDNNSSLN